MIQARLATLSAPHTIEMYVHVIDTGAKTIRSSPLVTFANVPSSTIEIALRQIKGVVLYENNIPYLYNDSNVNQSLVRTVEPVK
jgi:hypothetical protein